MSLRLQLLAFVALTLFLPWAGLKIVRAMEESLRLGLESSLERSAGVVAQAVADTGLFDRRRLRPAAFSRPLYLHPLSRQPLLDGLRNDWRFLRDPGAESVDARAIDLGSGSRAWLGIHQSFIYVFVEVSDDAIVYQAGPGIAPHGDRIVLRYGRDPAAPSVLLLASTAAGRLRGQTSSDGDRYVPAGDYEDLVRGAWRENDAQDGFTIEAFLPVGLVGDALGVGIVDTDPGDQQARLAAQTWNASGAPNALISESPQLTRALRQFAASPGDGEGRSDRFRVFDADGFVLADSGPIETLPTAGQSTSPPLFEQFLRRYLRRDDPEYSSALEREPGRIGDPALLGVLEGQSRAAWYRRGADVSAIVAAAVPIHPDFPERGAVLIEEASDPILTLTNRAMLGLVTTTVLVSLVASMALLAWASYLSFRVRRLARAAGSALGPRGEIRARLPGTRARDEIGDLSRSFEDLLGRLSEYTDYLQSLKSKLSHELRTPLAIVSTSLDNLEQEAHAGNDTPYIPRLRQGVDRLESILQAMTAATRVEQAIGQTEPERFDLAAVIGGCIAAYRDVYAARSFEANLPVVPVPVEGSAELVAQLLDKLVDNAVGFAAEGTAIGIRLERVRDEAILSVTNRGPLLPESMRHQLFDSLVSVRAERGERPHLGLGLYIVMLIAEFHGGRVEAENLADGSGVRFSVALPTRDARAA